MIDVRVLAPDGPRSSTNRAITLVDFDATSLGRATDDEILKLITDAAGREMTRDRLYGHRTGAGSNGYGWCGVPSNCGKSVADYTDDLLLNGWPEGAKLASEMKSALVDVLPPPVSAKRKLRWMDDGDEFCRDRLMNGHLDTMWRKTRRDIVGAPQTLVLGTNWGGNSGMSAEQLKWNGVALLALSDMLEDAGYPTEIRLASASVPWNGTAMVLLYPTVKRAGDALQPDQLAAMVINPSTFRSYGISMYALVDHQNIGYGYGGHVPADEYLARLTKQGHIDPVDILLPQVFDQAGAEKAIRSALKQLQGGDVEAEV